MFFFLQAEDGIRDLVRSRGLGDVYKRQLPGLAGYASRPVDGGFIWKYDLWVNGRTSMEIRRSELPAFWEAITCPVLLFVGGESHSRCLLYTSDAADERSSVDLGGRRIIKKKKKQSKEDVRQQ